MAQLEETFNVKFAERSKRGFALTSAGEFLFTHCKELFPHYQRIIEELESFKNIPQGNLIIGANLIFGSHVVVPCLRELQKKFPQLNIHLHLEGDVRKLIPLLNEGTVDIAILDEAYIKDLKFAHIIPLKNKSMLAVMASKNYLQKFPKIRKIEDMAHHRGAYCSMGTK